MITEYYKKEIQKTKEKVEVFEDEFAYRTDVLNQLRDEEKELEITEKFMEGRKYYNTKAEKEKNVIIAEIFNLIVKGFEFGNPSYFIEDYGTKLVELQSHILKNAEDPEWFQQAMVEYMLIKYRNTKEEEAKELYEFYKNTDQVVGIAA